MLITDREAVIHSALRGTASSLPRMSGKAEKPTTHTHRRTAGTDFHSVGRPLSRAPRITPQA